MNSIFFRPHSIPSSFQIDQKIAKQQNNTKIDGKLDCKFTWNKFKFSCCFSFPFFSCCFCFFLGSFVRQFWVLSGATNQKRFDTEKTRAKFSHKIQLRLRDGSEHKFLSTCRGFNELLLICHTFLSHAVISFSFSSSRGRHPQGNKISPVASTNRWQIDQVRVADTRTLRILLR